MYRKYKIAFVGNTSWSMYNFRLGVIRKFRDLGYEVIVIAPQDTFSAKLVEEGISFRHISINNYSTNWWGELLTLFRFIQLYRKEKVDFVFHYTIKPNIYGSIAAYLNKTPSIAITTGLGKLMNYSSTFGGRVTLSLYKLAGKLTKELWFLNNEDKEFFIQKKLISSDKTRVINGEGIDTTWYKPSNEIKKRQGIAFLFAGRIIWEKGVGEFVEVARRVKAKYEGVEFQILGFIDTTNPDAVSHEQIKQWQEGGIIKYLGEATDVRPYLEQVDCLVFPSYYREGLSRILLEAAAMEKPIITTDNVGCRDVVLDGKTGYLVKRKDVDDLEEKVIELLKMPREQRTEMGHRGRKMVVERFDEKYVVDKYLDFLHGYFEVDNKHP